MPVAEQHATIDMVKFRKIIRMTSNDSEAQRNVAISQALRMCVECNVPFGETVALAFRDEDPEYLALRERAASLQAELDGVEEQAQKVYESAKAQKKASDAMQSRIS